MLQATLMSIPPPSERPDLYDGFDLRDRNFTPEEMAYWNTVFSEAMSETPASKQLASFAERWHLPKWVQGLFGL